jgi:hypothetical protein
VTYHGFRNGFRWAIKRPIPLSFQRNTEVVTSSQPIATFKNYMLGRKKELSPETLGQYIVEEDVVSNDPGKSCGEDSLEFDESDIAEETNLEDYRPDHPLHIGPLHGEFGKSSFHKPKSARWILTNETKELDESDLQSGESEGEDEQEVLSDDEDMVFDGDQGIAQELSLEDNDDGTDEEDSVDELALASNLDLEVEMAESKDAAKSDPIAKNDNGDGYDYDDDEPCGLLNYHTRYPDYANPNIDPRTGRPKKDMNE